MTLLLAHPSDEALGRFVEGTLPDNERREVVAHIADCDGCRILVVDSAELMEPANRESRRWWLTIAATLILSAGIGGFLYRYFHDPLADVKRTYAHLKVRPLEARLYRFPYSPWSADRGQKEDADALLMIMQGAAADTMQLRGNDAKSHHARGVAHLLAGDAKTGIIELSEAANAEPTNASYWNDLAAAQTVARDLKAALSSANRSLALDPTLNDAIFNRALALEALGQHSDAKLAYERYLAADQTSSWAAEAQKNRDRLEP